MRNIALYISYDGSRYHGWQLQPDVLTVCGAVESSLSRFFGHTVRVTGCGRTDAGVHAERYCLNFRAESSVPAERLPFALVPFFPTDIAVLGAEYVPDDFNAITSIKKKEYTYKIYPSRYRNPFYVRRAYFYPRALDIGVMRAAACRFVGRHDFAAMRSTGSVTKTSVREVYEYEVTVSGDLVLLRVSANGFLYNMARAMAGTLVYVSEGKIAPDAISGILNRGDRRFAGPTLPPDGLYMTGVYY